MKLAAPKRVRQNVLGRITLMTVAPGASRSAVAINCERVTLPTGEGRGMEFGLNGAVLGTDAAVEAEFKSYRRDDFDLCVLMVVQLLAYAAVGAWLSANTDTALLLAQPELLAMGAVAFACTIIPTLATFGRRAVEDGRLAGRAGAGPQYDHVTGGAVVVGAIVCFGVVGLAFYADGPGGGASGLGIQQSWGALVLAIVCASFLGAIFGPRFSNAPVVSKVYGWIGRVGQWATPVANVASRIDSWLVFVVAPSAGVTQDSILKRYGLLVTTFAACGLGGWYLPAPLGLAPIAWAMLIIFSVGRRWNWVEDDRELAMLNADFESETLRVGFSEDLSDEALWSLLSLVFLVPLAMRQFHLLAPAQILPVVPAYAAEPQASRDFLAWLLFYGTELAKSVPFVDWSEIYEVHGRAGFDVDAKGSHHIVFAARTITDLSFLSTFLQVLSVGARTRKQVEMFRDPACKLDRLDPFIEPTELRKLVRFVDGSWRPDLERIRQFPTYNQFRLTRLKATADKSGPIYAAVAALLRSAPGNVDLNEKLMEAAASNARRGKFEKFSEAWSAVRLANAYDLDSLEFVRRSLNYHANFASIRIEVCRAIEEQIDPSRDKTRVLRHALLDNVEKEGLAEGRLCLLRALNASPADAGGDVAAILKKVAEQDGAKIVRATAAEMLAQYKPDLALALGS